MDPAQRRAFIRALGHLASDLGRELADEDIRHDWRHLSVMGDLGFDALTDDELELLRDAASHPAAQPPPAAVAPPLSLSSPLAQPPAAPVPDPLIASDAAILRKRARGWLHAAGRSPRDFRGGGVIVDGGIPCGWSDLSTPSGWAPGCYAVTENDGPIFRATGGTHSKGATAWTPVEITA